MIEQHHLCYTLIFLMVIACIALNVIVVLSQTRNSVAHSLKFSPPVVLLDVYFAYLPENPLRVAQELPAGIFVNNVTTTFHEA